MRINKLLSNKGICSRKETNRWIEAGRITVNGHLAICGQWVGEDDEILIDQQPIQEKEKVYILLNKPVGITCTLDSQVKQNIRDYINYPDYIFPVGRLDKDSEGLILMTNDGELADALLNAAYKYEKEYLVTVDKELTNTFLQQMAKGVRLGDKMTRPCQLLQVEEDTFKIILTQGMNRQIRKMCLAFGYKVKRLERIRLVSIEKGELMTGEWRFLTTSERESLQQLLPKL